MSVSFEVMTSDLRVTRMMGKPCFAAVNSIIRRRDREDNISIVSVKYLPFLTNKWCNESNNQIEATVFPMNMDWGTAEEWWKYLLSLKFITDGLVSTPTTSESMRQGFQVKADMPADRVMLTLFLLRAPQFQTGIILDWFRLVHQDNIHRDTAFVIAFALNWAEPHELNRNYHIVPQSSSESSIIYPDYLTVSGAKVLLNRLLCDDYDEVMFGGKQPKLSVSGSYSRAAKVKKDAIGRFLCKRPAKNAKQKNLQVTLFNSMLPDDVSPLKTHNDFYDRRYRFSFYDDDKAVDVRKLADMLEA
jgi:hypothetical protein